MQNYVNNKKKVKTLNLFSTIHVLIYLVTKVKFHLNFTLPFLDNHVNIFVNIPNLANRKLYNTVLILLFLQEFINKFIQMFNMQPAGVNFTTATYFHLTLPCFLTLLFLTSSETKVNTLFFQLSIWNTTNRNTYRHKSFQFKLKAYIIIAN